MHHTTKVRILPLPLVRDLHSRAHPRPLRHPLRLPRHRYQSPQRPQRTMPIHGQRNASLAANHRPPQPLLLPTAHPPLATHRPSSPALWLRSQIRHLAPLHPLTHSSLPHHHELPPDPLRSDRLQTRRNPHRALPPSQLHNYHHRCQPILTKPLALKTSQKKSLLNLGLSQNDNQSVSLSYSPS